MKIGIDLTVNGERHQMEVDPQTTLVEFLRESLHLTGTKEGCGTGNCGACTVLVDRKLVNSCLMLAADANGCQITTIEGLAKGENLHPLQKAFMEQDATQCGFCTPGMVLTAYGLLQKNSDPSESEIIHAMDDNLCRCGSYKRIIKAIQTAATEMRGGEIR